jgi:hypothetical protein
MESIIPSLIALVPLLVLAVDVWMLVYCYRHATPERLFLWLVLTAITGIIGFLFFWYSSDRSETRLR